MQTGSPLLSRYRIGIAFTFMVIAPLNTLASQDAIIGEADEGEGETNLQSPPPLAGARPFSPSTSSGSLKRKKPPTSSLKKTKVQKTKGKGKIGTSQDAPITREKLWQGFHQAEEFHKTWFCLPPLEVKTSLEKLTRFCKIACTKVFCKDTEIADKCHLLCPEATTRTCPDPLTQASRATALSTHIMNGEDKVAPSVELDFSKEEEEEGKF